jgi:SAM-dependent methyltransferase
MASKSSGFRRRLKSVFLRPGWAYRLSLRLRFGAGRLTEKPSAPLPNGALRSAAEWKQAAEQGRRLRVPLHRSEEKNWDHLAAVFAILGETTPSARVLDAGAELYSNVLPALFVYGYRDLVGINLDFDVPARRGPIRYLHGDITQTGFDEASFDAACCMSVIEHGVPLEGYFREMHRILKPGGLLITSTDYFPTPIDTRGQQAHGAPVKIFTRAEIEAALRLAVETGFELTGPVNLDCDETTVRWEQFGLDYTFLIFTLRKRRSDE